MNITQDILLYLFPIVFFIGIGLLFLLRRQQTKLGSLTSESVYKDTTQTPGEILYSKTLPLCGKPDYIIRENDAIIPVEVKTGKTPEAPYTNHTMQLMAYCLLVQEAYEIRPLGGIIKYPNKEFKVAFTPEAEESLKNLIKEIQKAKADETEFYCSHSEHYFKR